MPNKQESTGWNRLNTPDYGGEKKLLTKRRQWQMVNDFEALVWADYKYAEEIEQGRLPKDLKRMLDINLKVRTSRKRNRYPIIPFQHIFRFSTIRRAQMLQIRQCQKIFIIWPKCCRPLL